MLDLLLKNGKIVTESAVYEANIGVEGGKIATISKSISDSADRIIDAKGKLVLPGLIDAHTHMEMPFMGMTTADDFESGTVGAACGGVTTIIDLAVRPKGESLLHTYEIWRKKADPKVVIDYSFHLAPLEPDQTGLKELIGLGVPSFKLFTAYKKDLYTDDGGIFEIMTEMAKYGGMVNVHCENGDLIEAKTRQLHAEGNTGAIYHARSRPPPVEAEAIQRVLRLAEMAGSRVHIVHVSTKSGLDAIIEGRSRGLPVSAETCPHYLTMTEEEYFKPNAERLIMSPPLRTKEEMAALWFGLARGQINTVASDHTVFTSAQKKKNDFSQVPNGVPGTETILALLYSKGCARNGYHSTIL